MNIIEKFLECKMTKTEKAIIEPLIQAVFYIGLMFVILWLGVNLK